MDWTIRELDWIGPKNHFQKMLPYFQICVDQATVTPFLVSNHRSTVDAVSVK